MGGTPIGLVVFNEDQRPGDYKEMDSVPRPGHADYTYHIKMGTRASSGGGRSSARETIGRVAAGAIAEKWLSETYGTSISCWVRSIGNVRLPDELVPKDGWTRAEVDKIGTLRVLRDPKVWRNVKQAEEPDAAKRKAMQADIEKQAESAFLEEMEHPSAEKKPAYLDYEGKAYNLHGDLVEKPADLDQWSTDEIYPMRCPHPPSACKMASVIRQVKSKQDSIGGVVTCMCCKVPAALGEPVFDRLEAKLAHAMLSLPATKGFEIGSGFEGTVMHGSQHNDRFIRSNSKEPGAPALMTATNYAGGTLGGISNGANIIFHVAIKPVATIAQAMTTATYDGTETVLEAKGRHDPCVLPRAPALVEGMTSLVLIDAALIQRTRLAGSTTTRGDGTQLGPVHEALIAARESAKKARLQ